MLLAEQYIDLDQDQFRRQYPPILNQLADSDEALPTPGFLFQPDGRDLDFVRRQNPRHVWTLLGGLDGEFYLVSGFYWVNRIAYVLTREPVPVGIRVQVELEESSALLTGRLSIPQPSHT